VREVRTISMLDLAEIHLFWNMKQLMCVLKPKTMERRLTLQMSFHNNVS